MERVSWLWNLELLAWGAARGCSGLLKRSLGLSDKGSLKGSLKGSRGSSFERSSGLSNEGSKETVAILLIAY